MTFIPTGTDKVYPCPDMHEPCRRVIAAFGPDRCVWGSNFPCELWNPKVTYDQHLAIYTRELGLDGGRKRPSSARPPVGCGSRDVRDRHVPCDRSQVVGAARDGENPWW